MLGWLLLAGRETPWVISGEKAVESIVGLLPHSWAKQCLKPTISQGLLGAVHEALDYGLGEKVPKDGREEKQMAELWFSKFIF